MIKREYQMIKTEYHLIKTATQPSLRKNTIARFILHREMSYFPAIDQTSNTSRPTLPYPAEIPAPPARGNHRRLLSTTTPIDNFY
jgi:hypothetical protein